MKCLLVFVFVVLAVAHAQVLIHSGLVHPGLVAAPLAAPVIAPAIAPGYVAATRGAVHTAPLPGNVPYASHHLNLAPAPGTI